jgi:predicted naringenin-chalcone synthase
MSLANIISIGTALPKYCHHQGDILHFMQQAYGLNESDKRKLAFLYRQSGIKNRYSVVGDFGSMEGGSIFRNLKGNGFVGLEERMKLYEQEALSLSVEAIERCIEHKLEATSITHLITVSCTGLSAPGLDLDIVEAMKLPTNIFRTSVNFMGCYAAIHALKLAQMICDSTPSSNVIIVSTELCTLHFQQEYTLDNASSSLLFGDGSAAVLVSNTLMRNSSISLKSFSSQVAFKGRKDMSWQISSKGFLMTLSSYVSQLIEEDINCLVEKALKQNGLKKELITHWCIHPGGRKILDVIEKQLSLSAMDLSCSRKVLSAYGNMSSATILFVLKEILDNVEDRSATIFGIAFGPGLTMETFIASNA